MTERKRTRKELLRSAILFSVPRVPAQFDKVDPKYLYVPPRHVRALDPDTMLVTGIRGAGKSFWWHALQSQQLRDHLIRPGISVSLGFGETSSSDFPTRDELQPLTERGHAARMIWKAVVLKHLDESHTLPQSWDRLIAWADTNPSEVAERFRAYDEILVRSQRQHIVLFDALDRTSDSKGQQEELLSGLLELILELRSSRALRAKVFARPDMINSPGVKRFRDASKVTASAVKLEWAIVDLYALLFKYLANGDNEDARKTFQRLAERSGQLELVNLSDAIGSWLLPPALRKLASDQEKLFEALAGPYMGAGPRRGKTYTWVPNHLADALGQVSPRSFLAAIRAAADEPQKDEHLYPLHWTGLQEGVRFASSVRVDEIKEDIPWAHEAMKMLETIVVPCERGKALAAWQRRELQTKAVPGLPQKSEQILEELSSVGILKELSDGRFNIPDVYRLGFGLRRKGGFAPKRS